jgi:acetyl-CoA/propionyl-CoA carboxylase, biotin carboxylase, biotin carboxyl carrier protein
MVSFLEVNTRLQVEHPVTEETSGVDLVRAQFAIADGQRLKGADPAPRGHSIEFRINAEDPGRGFLPAPGTVARWQLPTGPGVRVDAGYVLGDTVPGAFDSLLAKLIVTGSSRQQAIERARRALAEFDVGGMPTILPFHRAVLDDPAFAPADASTAFSIHTRWIETEFANDIPPYDETSATAEPGERDRVTVEVDGRRLEVVLPAGLGAAGTRRRSKPPSHHRGAAAAAAMSGDSLTAPMQGTIVKVAVQAGQQVAAGDLIVVLEAMKMEQPINAHKAGTISDLHAEVGSSVQSGEALCRIAD